MNPVPAQTALPPVPPLPPLAAFRRLQQEAPAGASLLLLLLMLASSLLEGVGLLLLVPLLELLNQQDARGHAVVGQLVQGLQWLGLPLTLPGLLGVFLLLVVLRTAVQYARERLAEQLQHRVVDALRQRCFAALLGAEWRWMASGRKADHASMLLTDVSRVGLGLQFGLQLLASTVSGLAFVGAALALSWGATLAALACCAVVMVWLGGHRRAALGLGQQLGVANRALQSNVQESLAGIKLTKILGTESRHLALFARTTERLRLEQQRFAQGNSRSRAAFQLGGAFLLCAYLYAGIAVWHMAMAPLLVLVMLFSRLIPLCMTGLQQYHHCLHALPALTEVEQLLQACTAAAEPAAAPQARAMAVREAVHLDAVTVRYAGRQEAALASVSVRFAARTTTAVMGHSGAGKSTLADVLMGLLVPDAGQLCVDGVPVDAAQRMAWRRSVAYVPQEVFLFHDTIRHNLLWGREGADEAELVQALQRAAADFVLRLPAGLDTVVGDGGVRLSGGERQRIALARALLGRPSLLILDEATSALDLESEARVRQAIEQLHGDLTVVIIGHRLPTLQHADAVLVLGQGRVLAQGPWSAVQQHVPLPSI